MIAPLDDVDQTIALIADISGTPASEVRNRLQSEAGEIGTQVHSSLTTQGIRPYVASEKLDDFYRESDAFLYETTVWNTCDVKQKMRSFISSRLDRYLTAKADVFCFGDGLGFDSTWLAMQGHRVRYYEPSLRAQQYAQRVFAVNEVDVERLGGLDEIPAHSLDAIVCLDVLEHIPNPQLLVKQFHEWLKPEGLLFVHAPFWCIHWTRSTHLKENRHLSGDVRKLYHRQRFSALEASFFWDPIVLQKTDNPSPYHNSMGIRARMRLGQFLLSIGRWNSTLYTALARIIARPPKSWVAALK